MKLNDMYPELNEIIRFRNIKDNSKQVKRNDIFVAVNNKNGDGSKYISEAIQRGACFIITERNLNNFPSITVKDSNNELNKLLKKYYPGYKDLSLCAITGTDGKTTTSSIIHFVMSKLASSIQIGSNGVYMNKTHVKIKNTTPSNTNLFQALDYAKKRQIKYGVLEISSEGMLDGRGTLFNYDSVIFTNITREHLNTHKNMYNYIKCKASLLNYVKDDGLVIINNDMKFKEYIKRKAKDKHIVTYGIKGGDVMAKNIQLHLNYTLFDIYYFNHFICQIKTNLVGEFNVYNILAAFTYLYEIGFKAKDIKNELNDYLYVSGRFELHNINNLNYLIDYGHTPNAIYETLKFINKLNFDNIITILGAQGEKDRGKRKFMGKYASNMSNTLILTSEDPKYECIFSIFSDLMTYIKKDYYLTLSRFDAIKKASELATSKDLIVIFGKGNEEYEEIMGYKFKRNDLEMIKALGNS